MEKTINIDGKDVRFISTASTLRRYRQKFQRDLLEDMPQLLSAAQTMKLDAQALNTFESLAYIMAKQGDPENVPDDVNDWLDQFNTFSIYVVLPSLIELWNLSGMPTVEAKKK